MTERMDDAFARARGESRAQHLLALTTGLSEAATFDEVADVVFREGVRAFGADAGSLSLLANEDAGPTDDRVVLRVVRTAGYDPDKVHAYETFVVTRGRPLSDAMLTHAPVLVGTLEEWEAQYPGYFAAHMEPFGYIAFAAAPVVVGGRAIAGISFSFLDPQNFDESSRTLLETISTLCAQALDRARAFDAERRGRQRTQTILNAITDAYVAVDADFRYTFVNDRAASLLERRGPDMLGRTIWDVLPGADGSRIGRLFREVMATRVARVVEEFSVPMRRWIEIRLVPVEDGGLVAFIQDISQRRHAQESSLFLADASRVLTSSLEYETTLQNLAAAAVPGFADWCAIDLLDNPNSDAWPPATHRVALAHSDPERVRWADSLREQLPTNWHSSTGLARVIRDGVSQFLPRVTDDILRAAAVSDTHLSILRELRLASMLVVPLVSRGRILGGLTLVMAESNREYHDDDLAVAEDLGRRAANAIDNAALYNAAVAAQRAAELAADRTRRLQSLTASLAEAMTQRDVVSIIVEEGIVAAGAAAGLVILISDDRSTLTVASSINYSDEALQKIRAVRSDSPFPVSEVAATGQPVFLSSMDEWMKRYPPPIWSDSDEQAAAILPLNGSARLFGALSIRFSERRAFDADEQSFMLAMARQCGQALERAHLYDAERTARAEAEEANRAKMDFLATMSHELRTPLNAIGGYADLLILGVRGDLTADQLHDVDRIRASQQHLLSLINDVLNFAKLEAGKVEVTLAPVSLPDLLAALEPMLAPQLQAKRLTLSSMYCETAELYALADEPKLRQVLLNLVSNAVKFTPDGGRIALLCNHTATEVSIGVRDSGIGIVAEYLERIFDPFVQLERRLTNVVPGTGLGLAISRDLARAMGGDVTVESVPGEGSTFTVRLPRASR